MRIDELVIESLMSFARQYPSAKGHKVELEFTLDESGRRVCRMQFAAPSRIIELYPFYETQI